MEFEVIVEVCVAEISLNRALAHLLRTSCFTATNLSINIDHHIIALPVRHFAGCWRRVVSIVVPGHKTRQMPASRFTFGTR